MTWPTSYRSLAHRTISSDRSQYRREFCSSLYQGACIPCVQSTSAPDTSREGYLPMLMDGKWLPVNYSNEPWIAVARDPNWLEQPQYTGEAVPVEASYYNATRVCAQQFDRGNQGYCFNDWQSQSACWKSSSGMRCSMKARKFGAREISDRSSVSIHTTGGSSGVVSRR